MIPGLGYLYAILSAIIFGSMPLLTKNIYAYGCDSVSSAFYRMSLSLVFVYLFLRIGKKMDMRINRRELFNLILAAFGFMLTSLTLFQSYHFISSGAATSIHFTYPILIFLAVTALLRERPTAVEILCIIMATTGLVALMDFSQLANLQGIIYAFISAITYAFYSIYLEKSNICRMPPLKVLFYVNLFGAMMILGYALLTGKGIYRDFNGKEWMMVLLFSLIITVGATFLYQLAVIHIGAKNTSVLSTCEPIVSILIGFFILHENLTKIQLIAVLLIFIASLTLILYQRKKNADSQQQDITIEEIQKGEYGG